MKKTSPRLQLNALMAAALTVLAVFAACTNDADSREPVDYVDPYIGNVSHLLVPTFPTVQLPNSMLRVYPERADYTSEYISGLPIIVTNHRERSAFRLIPQTIRPDAPKGDVWSAQEAVPEVRYTYDNEHLTPYSFAIDFDDNRLSARYALSHQSAIYEIGFREEGGGRRVVLCSQNGGVTVADGAVSGWQTVSGETKVYVYLESETQPASIESITPAAAALNFAAGTERVRLRYGVSFISEEQARKNLHRELQDYDLDALAQRGRQAWNDVLSRISVTGGTDEERTVLYTSYYRTFERPICMSEDGHYWSGDDNQVHNDGGTPFYTDDWIWDTYRAAHPLRAITDRSLEENILASFLRMADNNGTGWIPTFPEVNGDSRRMNSNHTVATFADAVALGLDVDARAAYEACRRCIEEKSLAPWSGNAEADFLNAFYAEHGYIPALRDGEAEQDVTVHPFEKRQPIAVTLGTSYDEWCLSLLADHLASLACDSDSVHFYQSAALRYMQHGYNYRNVFNPETQFFHPKDRDGRFIEPFDYAFPGGMGAREYYGENNGWVYRWDVQHNVNDLIALMGGKEQFVRNLDETFAHPLGRSKYEFYAKLPDHTGNVGQFSMANEPSLHIPYLYNYAGQPWKTQKRIRQMLRTWFRNDLMGVPGDEDGGGLTSFVVFSMLGFYPVTPGTATYNIGSPTFPHAELRLTNGKTFVIDAEGASADNKYIQSATLNGEEWNQPWFSYDDIRDGGHLVLRMGNQPNRQWGVAAPPLSAGITH